MNAAAATFAFHAWPDAEAWTHACTAAIVDALHARLRERPRAKLLLSGGGTPGPVYAALAGADLDWMRIDVCLVDDRWVPADDPGSNARLLRETLLRGDAAIAFHPLVDIAAGLEASVQAASDAAARQPADVVVLGMGDDGHTASLFPGMRDLDAALRARAAYIAVDASGCPVAGRLTTRISLTPAGLAPAHTRLLLLRGADKRAVFERAAAGDDPAAMPIRIALAPDAPLQVHWTA